MQGKSESMQLDANSINNARRGLQIHTPSHTIRKSIAVVQLHATFKRNTPCKLAIRLPRVGRSSQ